MSCQHVVCHVAVTIPWVLAGVMALERLVGAKRREVLGCASRYLGRT